jgi:hypothetical protein
LGTENSAVYKAYIKDDKGNLLSTGHKSESKNNFSYFREKAETGSIGRALNFLGYGTQFCADELDEGHRIVDEPIKPVKKNSEQDKKPKEDIKKYRTADLVKIRERLDQKVEAGSDLNEAEQRNYDIILAELIRRDEEANK